MDIALFYPFTIRKNNNKTGFNDPVPDFIQKECHGWRAKLTENVKRPFIMDLITFIGKFLALLQFYPAE